MAEKGFVFLAEKGIVGLFKQLYELKKKKVQAIVDSKGHTHTLAELAKKIYHSYHGMWVGLGSSKVGLHEVDQEFIDSYLYAAMFPDAPELRQPVLLTFANSIGEAIMAGEVQWKTIEIEEEYERLLA